MNSETTKTITNNTTTMNTQPQNPDCMENIIVEKYDNSMFGIVYYVRSCECTQSGDISKSLHFTVVNDDNMTLSRETYKSRLRSNSGNPFVYNIPTDSIYAYSAEMNKLININSLSVFKPLPMNPEEEADIKEKIKNYLINYLMNKTFSLKEKPIYYINPTQIRRVRYFLFGVTNDYLDSFIQMFSPALINDPRLADDISVYDDLKKIFEVASKYPIKDHFPTKQQLMRLVTSAVFTYEIYLRPDFLLYYTALADEYNFSKKFTGVLLMKDCNGNTYNLALNDGDAIPALTDKQEEMFLELLKK